MPSKFGGIPLTPEENARFEEQLRTPVRRSRFGGIPIDDQGRDIIDVPRGTIEEQTPPADLIDTIGQQVSQVSEPVVGGIREFGTNVADLFTGRSRMTDVIEQAPEIGSAPELNRLSTDALTASLGLLTTGNEDELQNILKEQLGDEEVSFLKDEKGNVLVQLPSGTYALNKPGLSGQDIARGVFEGALFLRGAGRARNIREAAVRSGLVETGLEATEAALGGEFDLADVGISSLIGAVGKGLEDVVGAGVRAFRGKIAPETQEIIRASQQQNIPLYASDVTQPRNWIAKQTQIAAERIPIVGTGPLRESQQAARVAAVSDVADKYSQFSYSAIVDSLEKQKSKVKKAAGNVLNKVGVQLDNVGDIPLTNTNDAIAAAERELTKPGVIRSDSALRDLKTITDTLSEAPQTFTTLKENRTIFREIVAGADKVERSQLPSKAKATLKKVEDAMTKDMESMARANLTPREFGQWKKANTVYAQQAKTLTKSRLKNVLDKGDVTPESVANLLFSSKPSEIKTLYNSLGVEGKRNARIAIINKAIEKARNADKSYNPTVFANEMGKLGLSTDTFFKGEERKILNGLLDVLNNTRRAQEFTASPPTGAQLIPMVFGASAYAAPGTTSVISGTIGLGARTLETPPVRNALLKLANTPKGSDAYERALTEAINAMTAYIQATQE